ncbi:hypothetical protein AB0M28_23100 [Streptomyces sp. NPDC051940]|uniref:dioxygenase family protein n=1 Tax=Streptomyces sp. NPDC051940 TaxID=3155675 RepID=UPI003429DD4E
MHDDDLPVGRILSRRRALALLGAAGATAAVGGTVFATSSASAEESTAAADVVAKPEMTEGPYYVDEGLKRSDIRTDTSDGTAVDGTRLDLALIVSRIAGKTVTPLPDATVDIWHCDASGIYSDIASEGTEGHDFLRGYQVTNSGGLVRFTTVLPGWYQGRTVHIHVKVQTTGTDGNAYEFTSQLYLPEDFKTAYLATDPYAAKGTPDTTNDSDMHYADIGDQMLLQPTRNGDGYKATFRIGLDLSDTAVAADDSFSQGGGPGPGGGGTPPDGPPPSGSPTPPAA